MATGIVDPTLSQPWAPEGAPNIGKAPVAGAGGERGTSAFAGNADYNADYTPVSSSAPTGGGPGNGVSYHQTENPTYGAGWGPNTPQRESAQSSSKGTTVAVTTASSLSPVHATSVTLTSTVTGTGDTEYPPTGVVTFKDGSTVLGTGVLSNAEPAVATLAVTAGFTAGAHTISSVYAGDADYTGATSANITVTAS